MLSPERRLTGGELVTFSAEVDHRQQGRMRIGGVNIPVISRLETPLNLAEEASLAAKVELAKGLR